MSRRYFWLKLREDFFRDKAMKKMRRIAGGDTYVIIYLKMMLMSIQTEGELYFDGIENDFAAELALALDEDEDNVRVAIGFLLRSGKLIEKVNQFTLCRKPMKPLVRKAAARKEYGNSVKNKSRNNWKQKLLLRCPVQQKRLKCYNVTQEKRLVTLQVT